MRVLVTGAAGFVGRALCRELVQHGHELRRAMRKSAGTPAPEAGATVLVEDVGPSTDWTAAVEGVDAVVHLAARVHMLEDTAADALAEYRRVNVEGTRSLAAAALRAGVRRLVFLSSAKVHGERSVRPFTEADAPHPEDAYAVSKIEAEEALKETLAGAQTQWTILRPPLVYGPEVRANFLRLLRAVARGVPLPLAVIDNRRSLIYVGNLVDALRVCLSHPGAADQTLLPSDGEDVSTSDLVRRLAAALQVRPRLLPVPVPLLRAAGWLAGRRASVDRLIDSLQVDSLRIRAALGWVPPFSLDQGLAGTARWYRATEIAVTAR